MEQTPLQKATEARQRMREAGITPERLSPIEKAAKNPHSLRAAINGKCWDCVGGDCDPKPRERIAQCPASKCSLHPLRPYQSGTDE